MKKSFTRALKDLHRLESARGSDGIALQAVSAATGSNAWKHIAPHLHDEVPNDSLPSPRETSRWENRKMFAPRIRPIPEQGGANSDVQSTPIVETDNSCDDTEKTLKVSALREAPMPRRPIGTNDKPTPSPTALPLATAFEEEVQERLGQSTNLRQFEDLASRLTRGFSPGFAGTIAVAHLGEIQQTLQVIASVAHVLGSAREIKTLLVDTDVDHKTLSKCFEVDRHEGFGEACERVRLWPHLIHPTATPAVSILPAGNCVERTEPGIDRVRQLLSALSSDEYSVVLINAGDILNPLRRHACQAADSAHLLLRLGRSERGYTARAIHTSGIKFEGIIVTTLPQIS